MNSEGHVTTFFKFALLFIVGKISDTDSLSEHIKYAQSSLLFLSTGVEKVF